MRLWHKSLIPVLPNKQLISQWRELNCIAKTIQIKKTPNHILVNKILDYNLMHFVAYTKLVLTELDKRNFDIKKTTFKKFLSYINISQDYFDSASMSFLIFISIGIMIDIYRNVIIIFKRNMIVKGFRKKNGIK